MDGTDGVAGAVRATGLVPWTVVELLEPATYGFPAINRVGKHVT
jgi:hypothetical protein